MSISSKTQEFKVTRTETSLACATPYRFGAVAVHLAGGLTRSFNHEDKIPEEWKKDAPELYEFVRAELCRNRPLKADETRALTAHSPEIVKMSVEGDHLVIPFTTGNVLRHDMSTLKYLYADSRTEVERHERGRRLKFFEDHLYLRSALRADCTRAWHCEYASVPGFPQAVQAHPFAPPPAPVWTQPPAPNSRECEAMKLLMKSGRNFSIERLSERNWRVTVRTLTGAVVAQSYDLHHAATVALSKI